MSDDITEQVDELARTDADFKNYVAAQLRTHTLRLDGMEPKVDEVHSILLSARGFFKVCNGMGRVARWVTVIAGAAVALYHLFFSHQPPPPTP